MRQNLAAWSLVSLGGNLVISFGPNITEQRHGSSFERSIWIIDKVLTIQPAIRHPHNSLWPVWRRPHCTVRLTRVMSLTEYRLMPLTTPQCTVRLSGVMSLTEPRLIPLTTPQCTVRLTRVMSHTLYRLMPGHVPGDNVMQHLLSLDHSLTNCLQARVDPCPTM